MSSPQDPAQKSEAAAAPAFWLGVMALGVVAALGLLWLHRDSRVATAQDELAQIANKVASIYTTSHTVDPGSNMAFSPGPAAQAGSGLTYIQAGAFPADAVRNGTTVTNPWGGTIIVQSATTQAPDDSYAIEFTGLPRAACAELLTTVTKPHHQPLPSFYAVSTSNANLAATTRIAVPADGVTSTIARGLCASDASPPANAVSFKFPLNH